MHRRRAALGFSVIVLLLLLGGYVGGCLGRSLPIPPPGVSASEVTVCPATQCPSGGVIVTLSGTAAGGAQVIVEDTSPSARTADGDVVGGVARATTLGTWRIVVGPLRDPVTGVVLAVQRGDSLNVYQVTPAPDGETSSSHYVDVPLH